MSTTACGETLFIAVHAMLYVGDKDTKDNQGSEGEAALNNQRYVIIHSYGVKVL